MDMFLYLSLFQSWVVSIVSNLGICIVTLELNLLFKCISPNSGFPFINNVLGLALVYGVLVVYGLFLK
jgi:hypothetical protein